MGWGWRAWRGWRTVCTSTSPTMIRPRLEFVARSAAENRFDPSRFQILRLDWRDLPDRLFPVILGADVIYEALLVPLVANLLSKLLAPGGLGLIASPYRVAAEAFPAALASHSLTFSAEPARARALDGRTIEGTIYHVTRTGT